MSADVRYTYRFVKNGRASEIHADDEESLLRRATEHLESGLVLPVHIRRGREIVDDIRDITDAWEERYLTREAIPVVGPPLLSRLGRRADRRGRPDARGRPLA